ncbi:periplasmic solute binding protein [Thermus thermophilus]|uniref:metal ABC transporter substrate-binding protein n=1 Tax=Thermus thermophilus TaxID=274 RepID=UPI00090AD1E8|nr:metal ABC transporter substrate-binding protein [Thermus thermophilus]BAW00468.1 periplasmic solute binding protein [Thermus thermophilus]BDB11191.1 ABC transporter substrate-binding protein [Thermus thermophilus]
MTRTWRVLGPWLLALWASLALAQGVVATTPVLASLAQAVAGERFRVESIVPPGADPHAFDLRPSAVQQLAGARLLIANGLGLEPYLPRLKALLPPGAEVLELAPRMPDPICGLRGLQERGVHLHGDCDPHMWLDPTYGVRYAEVILEELLHLDPRGEAAFRRNLESLRRKALEEDAALRACLGGRRLRLVVAHLSLSYLARRYGLEVVGALRSAHGAEEGVKGRIALLREAELRGVDLVAAEPQYDPAPLRRLAEELGARLVVLYTDVLDRRVPGYLELLRWNRERLCEAVRERR